MDYFISALHSPLVESFFKWSRGFIGRLLALTEECILLSVSPASAGSISSISPLSGAEIVTVSIFSIINVSNRSDSLKHRFQSVLIGCW